MEVLDSEQDLERVDGHDGLAHRIVPLVKLL